VQAEQKATNGTPTTNHRLRFFFFSYTPPSLEAPDLLSPCPPLPTFHDESSPWTFHPKPDKLSYLRLSCPLFEMKRQKLERVCPTAVAMYSPISAFPLQIMSNPSRRSSPDVLKQFPREARPRCTPPPNSCGFQRVPRAFEGTGSRKFPEVGLIPSPMALDPPFFPE